MLNRYPFWKNWIRVVHLPTGIEAICSFHRSQHKNRDSALKRLKALLWAKDNIQEDKDVLRYSYTLDDNDSCPDDISKYRKRI